MNQANFKRKEITRETPLGEKLKQAREKKGLDLLSVEEETKIRAKYLQSLEEENWENLPSDTYTKGFLQSYGQFLGLPASSLLSQYKRERKNTDLRQLLLERKEIKFPKFYLTPKSLGIIFFGLIISALFFYISWQVQGFTSPPSLSIKSPYSGVTVFSDFVIIEGKSSPGATLFINNQMISADEEGNFKEEIKLKKGINTILISARNRMGKKTEKEIIISSQSE